jgi:hypothetical protein
MNEWKDEKLAHLSRRVANERASKKITELLKQTNKQGIILFALIFFLSFCQTCRIHHSTNRPFLPEVLGIVEGRWSGGLER